jgi:hypothetical protein
MEPDAPKLDPQRPRPSGPGLSRPAADTEPSRPSGPTEPAAPQARPPAPAPPPPPKSRTGLWIAAIIIAAFLAVGYAVVGGGGGNPSGSGITAGDKLIASETQSPEYQKHKNRVAGSAAKLSSADLNAQQTQAAIDAVKAGQPIPGLTSASPELKAAVQKGDVKFYTVRAYDTCAEDGDWVTLTTSNGAKIGSFMLLKAGTTVSIPVIGGQIPKLQLTGDKDGVGGITVGVITSGGTWYSSILSPGESEEIPLTVN